MKLFQIGDHMYVIMYMHMLVCHQIYFFDTINKLRT